MNARFSLGDIVGTPGAIAAIEHAGDSPLTYLARHVTTLLLPEEY